MPIKFGLWTGRNVHVPYGGGETQSLAQPTEAEVLAPPLDAVIFSDVLALIKGKALGHADLEGTCREVEIADVCERALGRPDGFGLPPLAVGL